MFLPAMARGGPVIHRITIVIVKFITPEDIRGSVTPLGRTQDHLGL
jgi:hypothetical protein